MTRGMKEKTGQSAKRLVPISAKSPGYERKNVAGELDADTLPSCAVPGACDLSRTQQGSRVVLSDKMDSGNGPSRCLIGTVGAAGSCHQPALAVPQRKLERVEPVAPKRPVGVSGSGPVTGLILELEHRDRLGFQRQSFHLDRRRSHLDAGSGKVRSQVSPPVCCRKPRSRPTAASNPYVGQTGRFEHRPARSKYPDCAPVRLLPPPNLRRCIRCTNP